MNLVTMEIRLPFKKERKVFAVFCNKFSGTTAVLGKSYDNQEFENIAFYKSKDDEEVVTSLSVISHELRYRFPFCQSLQAELYPCNLSGRLFREKVCLRHRPPPTNERPNNWGPTLQMAAFHFNSQIGRGIPPRNKLTKLSRHGIYQKSTQPQFWENDFTHKKCVCCDIIKLASEQLKYFQNL